MELLTFHVGDEAFAVELSRVVEILAPQPFTRAPAMPPTMRGFISLRGKPTVVLDGGLRLTGRKVAVSERTPIVVMSARRDGREEPFGLLVDAPGRKVSVEKLLPLTASLGRLTDDDACLGFADIDGGLVLVLDTDRLLTSGGTLAVDNDARSGTRTSGCASTPTTTSETAPSYAPALSAPPTPSYAPALSAPPAPGSSPAPAVHPATLAPKRVTASQAASARTAGPTTRPTAATRTVTAASLSARARALATSRAEPSEELHRPPAAPGLTHGSVTPQHVATWSPRREGEPSQGGPPHDSPRQAPTATSNQAAKSRGSLVALLVGAAAVALGIALVDVTATRSPSQNRASTEERTRPPARPLPVEPTAAAVSMPTARTDERRTLPAAMVVRPDTPPCEIYEVQAGDTLWRIAAHKLGNPFRWPELYGENRTALAGPDLLRVHDRIRIPGACVPDNRR